MSDIKVTLILPSLNVADYIEEALKSVCEQTLKDIEMLCIDAGSNDGTLEIIEKYASSDSRIRIIDSEKRSYGYQVNLGIDNARGKYIAVLETDDFVSSDMYGKLYETAEEYDADYVKADYDAFISQDDGKYHFFPRRTFADLSLYGKVLCPRENTFIGRDDWYLWQGIYKRDYLKENAISFSETPGAAFQDIGFLIWTGFYAEKAVYLRDTFYHYRIDRETASSNLGKGLKFSYAEFSAVMEKLGDLDKVDKSCLELMYARMAKSFISCYSRIDERPEAVEERHEIYEWFRDKLKSAIDNGILTENIIFSGHLDKLKLLLESEEKYFEKNSVNCFDKIIGDKKDFAIFGCGDFGYNVYRILKSANKNILCFLDNKESLWGGKINEILIKSPDEALKLSSDTYIVIANEAHYNDMRDQLVRMGISTDRLIVFR